jgi:hypothetical protein
MSEVTETRQHYLEQGICPSCKKNPIVSNRKRCKECLESCRMTSKRRRNTSRKNDICTACNKNCVAPGKTICQSCLDQGSVWAKNRRKERSYAFLCSECGEPLKTTKYKTCAKCRAIFRERKHNLYLEHVALGICPTCSKPHEPDSLSRVYCTKCYIKGRIKRIARMSHNRYGGHLEEVIERDKGCVVCGRPWEENGENSMQVVCHHIDDNATHNNPDNLVMLCRNCHTAITAWLSCPNTANLLKFLVEHYPPTTRTT